MDWISLLQPSSLSEWMDGYLANVHGAAELDAVGDSAWSHFQQYLAVSQQLTREDFQGYVRELAFNRTYNGWEDRRTSLLEQLVAETLIPFGYLRDSPADWRPKTYDIDFAALHPTSERWLAVKALPASTTRAGYPGVAPRLDDMRQKHAEFADKWGDVVIVQFSTERNTPKRLSDIEVEKVRSAWARLATS